MANYQKYEKNRNSDDLKSITKFKILNYITLAIYFIILIVLIDCIESIYTKNSSIIAAAILPLGMCCIMWLYLFLRFLLIDLKGEFKYNDATLCYKGFSFDVIPEKTEVNLPFTDISAAKIYSEKIGKFEREILLITKSDGTEIELNICNFNTNEIESVMYQKMLDNPIPGISQTKYKIHIRNYKTVLWGYLNLNISINGKQVYTENDNPTINVKTGDLLTIKNKNRIQILRLIDPELTKITIDDFTDDFIVKISKPSLTTPTSC
jgi:hypothetical protein